MQKKIDFRTTQFVVSCTTKAHYPKILNKQGKPLAEIALAGRSNVGKSSLINDLCGTKKLAKTSSTPGKTQLINFFSLPETLVFVDLPGYGYAKVPPTIKDSWGSMIQEYLESRKELQLIFFLLDIRRDLNEEDLQFLRWVSWQKKPCVIVLTKIDKISKSEIITRTKKIETQIPYDNINYIHYSAVTHEGKETLLHFIQSFINEQ